MVREAGFKPSDFGYINYIVSHESGWNPRATNPQSGAYDIPQSLPGYQEWQQLGNSYYALMEHTLIKRIVTYTPQYFAWVTNFALPFSNNLSERSLRGVKSKMKVAGQFENITSSKNYATIRSYIETSYRNEKNPTKALEKLMVSKPYQVKELLQK